MTIDLLPSVEETIAKITSKHIRIVAVIKKQSLEKIEAYCKSCKVGPAALGVNYTNEGSQLYQTLDGNRSIEWHFIGHLQSRKAKLMHLYQWLHSLDRIEVAATIEKDLKVRNQKINTLIQVNLGNEASKSGILEKDLDDFAKKTQAFSQIAVRGLMILPPPLYPVEDRRPFFSKARTLFERGQSRYGWDTLSMGTSEDYLLAIQEGATMVRLGTALFGKRLVDRVV